MTTHGSTYEATYGGPMARVASPVTQPIGLGGRRPRPGGGATDATRHGPNGSWRDSRAGRHLGGLDGLRAVAIAAVVVFHLDPTWLPGGFLGVDVFFVVSGFLITTLLVRQAESRRSPCAEPISTRTLLARFWVRRARRLLPALAACLLLSTVVARVVHPDLLVHVGRQIVAALTFTTNWVEIGAGSSYFDQTAPQLFMNMWSLAVEEQFYLVWPLVVLALVAARARPGTRALLAGVAALVSTALMALLASPGQDATRVYYGTDTHLVGLMLGAALGFVWVAPGHAFLASPRWAAVRRPLLVVAAAGLGYLLWVLGESNGATFRGGIALGSLATTVLVAGLLPTGPGSWQPSRWRTLMDAPLLTWVGRRSYGIYLWHWPVILMVGLDERTAPGTPGHVASRVWAVLVTLALADLSYRFLEAPVRAWGFRAVALMVVRALFSPFTKVPRIVAGGVAVLLALAVVVVVTAPRESETEALLDANASYAGSASAAPTAEATGGAGARGTVTLPSTGNTAGTTTAAPSGAPTSPSASASGSASASASRGTAGASSLSYAMPSGPDIDIFGDSLVVASIHALDYYFPGQRADARSNRQWSDGLAQLQAHRGDLRRAVVLAFGTNAGVDATTLTRALDVIGPDHMVVLVTIYGHASWIDQANATLSQAAAGRGNVVVADWHGAISGHPELLQSDGIHPTITGAHLYAKTIRAALAALSEAHTGQKVSLPDLPVY